MQPIILIPARMASTRLPNKPMALINGEPMIVQVWRRAKEAAIGEVAVACDGEEIAEAIRRAGGIAVLTDPNLPSGSDRIFAALQIIDPKKTHDVIINLQGDMPTLDPKIIARGLKLLENASVDIGTLAAPMTDKAERLDSAVVKVIVDGSRAVSFRRQDGEGYHHIGIYFYRRKALERFVALPPSENEKREKLEQLRAMDNGMRIDVAIVDTVPLGVDTPETLEKARKWYEQQGR